jgi:hypothetical protein
MMDSDYFNRLKTKLKSSIENLNELPPIKLGIVYAVLIISITKLIYLIINYTYLILILYNLLRLFISIFCIFSLFTWLSLILSGNKYLTDTRIFVLLLTCFTSEFLIQFMVFNTNLLTNINSFNDLIKYLNSTYFSQLNFEIYDDNNNYLNVNYKDELELINNNNNNSNNYQSTITSLNNLFCYLVENFHNALIIGLTCTLANCFYTKRLNINENLFIVLIVFLTRFYGIVNFSSLIPNTICAYFTYFCAFNGVLFSKYLENFLEMFNRNDNKIDDSNGQNENKTCFDSIIKNLTIDSRSEDNNSKSGPKPNSKSTIVTNKSKWSKFLNYNNHYKRRISLPTITQKCEKEQVELNALIALKKDIQSIIDDVFNNAEQLNVLNLVKGYKSIQSRLNQVNLLTYSVNKSSKNGYICGKINHKNNSELLANEKCDLNDDYDEFNSYSADEDEETRLNSLNDDAGIFLQTESKQASSQKKNKNRVNSNNTINVPVQFLTSSYNKHRNSQILTWSTATSANGYPNIELLQSSKQRSLSLRGSNLQINNHLINFNSVDNKLYQKYSNNSNNNNNKRNENDLNFKEFSMNINKLFNQPDSKCSLKKNDLDSHVNSVNENNLTKTNYEDKNVQNDNENANFNNNNKINTSKAAKTSDYDSCESPNSSDYNSDTDKLQLKVKTLRDNYIFFVTYVLLKIN